MHVHTDTDTDTDTDNGHTKDARHRNTGIKSNAVIAPSFRRL
jgi:hypothetical protein